MKTVCILLILFSFPFLRGQSISGKLFNGEAEPLPFATILLNDAKDSVLVKATTSNENGFFELKGLSLGTYRLAISSIGFASYKKTVELYGENLELGRIVMASETQNLEEVTVVAEKPMVQVLADKTVFNVANTINATGTSAFELLRKAPGIVIDNNGGVIVEGKAGVQFYIDGKPSILQGEDLINYLESLQATDIEALEIITQPSSKYDAAGNAGIINIKFKKDKSLGTNGSIASGITIGNFKRYNTSISFNSRGKQGNLYGTYSNRFGKSANFLNLFRRQGATEFDAKTKSVLDKNSNNVKLGYDFYASTKSTFGAIFNGNFNNSFDESDSRTPIRPIRATMNDSVLVANNRSSFKSYNVNTNVNYRYTDTLGYTVNVDLDYGKYKSDRDAFQPNFYFDGSETEIIDEQITRQDTPINIDILTAKIDYEQNFWKGKLGLGAKFSFVTTTNTFDFFNIINQQESLDVSQSNQFEYDEQINAAYFNYNRKWEKWNVQFGLRMENTISDGNLISGQDAEANRVKRNYVDLFPSGGLTYQYNRKNQFALTYSKRIQRPNYQSLNPFEYKIDELSFSKGNPFLQPQYTNNLKFSHTYNYRLTTSLSYSYISDFFARVTVAEGDSRNFITTRNVANQQIINLGVSYPGKINNWWRIFISVNAYQSKYNPTSPDFLAVTQETLSLYAQNTFSLPTAIQMELSGWYNSPSIWGGTYRSSALGSLNLAFQRKFFADRLTAQLSFNDLLYTSPWSGTTQFGELFIDGSGGVDSRQVAFSLNYNFGRNEIKKARKRKTGLEDEKGRIE